MRALGMHFAIGGADLIPGRRLVTGDWLETVIFTSLFTDAQAPADLVPAGEFRGGYWGDTFSERSLGSLLWTLRREKITQKVLMRARDICLDALVWLLDAQHIAGIDVATDRLAADRLGITVTCTKADGSPVTLRYFQQQDISNAV